MNQLYVYICSHISSLLHHPPSQPPYPTSLGVTKHWADLPVLCGCFPLAIYFTFGSVYMSMPLSHFVPAYPSPSPCPQVHSLRLYLYSCPAPRFFSTIFFFKIPYICVSIRCFSLSDLLDSVWQTLGPSTSRQIVLLMARRWPSIPWATLRSLVPALGEFLVGWTPTQLKPSQPRCGFGCLWGWEAL